MLISVENLQPMNMGQVVSFGYDAESVTGAKEKLNVMGLLEGVTENWAGERVLRVAGHDYTFLTGDKVDLVRNGVLSHLIRKERQAEVLAEAVEAQAS